MEYRRLATTGIEVSELCFGTWRFGLEADDGTIETDREQAHELLDAFDEHGGNFIDTANGYGGGLSETWIGEWLQDKDREDYVIASKCYWSDVSRFQENLSRKNVRAEVEGSLEKLDTEYLDLLYLHRFDDETPIERTLRTVDDLVSEGKIHSVGISSCDAWKLTKGLWKADVNNYEAFTVTQPRFNAADRPQEYLDVCADQDIAVCPYSPLDGGFLTGKYSQGDADDGSRADLHDWDMEFSDQQWTVLDAVESVAEEVDATAAQVSLRWLIEQREFTCVPIFGARTVEQMEDNLGAVDISLSDEQYEQIEDAY